MLAHRFREPAQHSLSRASITRHLHILLQVFHIYRFANPLLFPNVHPVRASHDQCVFVEQHSPRLAIGLHMPLSRFT